MNAAGDRSGSDAGAQDRDAITFGAFRLIPSRRLLTRDGALVPLGARAMDVLIHLATRAGVVVDQDSLLRAAWAGRAVEPNNLSVQIAALRRAIGHSQGGTALIQTVPGRGYVFVADLRPSVPARTTEATPVPAAAAPKPPSPATPLIGRHTERAAIAQGLAQRRLVTITGTGGIGKTHLAAHLTHALASGYPDGAWFVDLSVLANADLVAEAVTTALGIGSGERPATERLVVYLEARHALLVLDNCEHLIDAAASLTETLLRRCPGLSILATSRESLFLPGEMTVRLSSLAFPAETDGIDAATARGYDAIALFVERASVSVSGFVFDDAAAPWIARICASLDGIALAIEMAVPRLKVLSPAQFADRLTERFQLPANPSRNASPRHRTLRAMIDWSYDLLSADEQALLRRLSLFTGGADLAAGPAIAAPPGASEWELLDQLTSLAEKSLLIIDTATPRRRFRLLETIRQYASQRLHENGEGGLRRRHAEHFASQFEIAEACWSTTPTDAWLAQYGDDIDNLRAALSWAFDPDGDVTIGLRLVGASYPLWWDLPQMPVPEGRQWFDRATRLITPTTPVPVAARLWLGASWRDMRYNDRESLPAARRALDLFRQTGDAQGLGGALWRVGATTFAGTNAAETRALCAELERILRPLGPSKWLVMNLVRTADTAMFERRLDAALPYYQEALAMADALGHWYGRLVSTTNMAEVLFDLGQRDRAIDMLQTLRTELSPRRRAPLLAPLVAHLLIAGRTADMLETARETLALSSMIGLSSPLGWVIEALALVVADGGDREAAARFAGFARRIHPATAGRVGARRAVLYRLQTNLHTAVPSARRARLAAEGAAWTEVQAASCAMQVCTAGPDGA